MTNETAFRENMTVLCELFDKPLTKLLMGIYWKALEPFTNEECQRAFNEVALSSKFFPKPADLLEILRGKIEDQGARAWIQVGEAVRRYGNYQSVCFADPVIHSVIEFMGGWGKTGDWTDQELKWKEKEFVKLYGIMQRNEKHPGYLPGVTEMQNAADGYEQKPEIARIGFDERAKEIAA